MKAKYLYIVLMLISTTLVMAQPTSPGDNGSPFDAPIGQGVLYAMIFAVSYGVRNIKKKRN